MAQENGNNPQSYPNDNRISILLGGGDGSFQPPVAVSAGDNPVAIVAGQFNDDNHDGRIDEADALDLAVANSASNDVTVLMNDGSGSFSTGLPVPASDTPDGLPFSLAAGDFDRDGDTDLAVANLLSADVSILVNIGNGSFARLSESLPAEIGPQAVIAADLEGDGDLDLIVTNGSSQHLGILRNLSDPVTHQIRFAPLEGFAVGNFDGGPSYSVIAGHFNADEDLDLAVAVGEIELRTGQSIPDVPQNYVSVLLNDVFEGAHRVTVPGPKKCPPWISASARRATCRQSPAGTSSTTSRGTTRPRG